MFNIGFGELAIICIVLIIAVGPDRLPSMMKTLGKTLRTLRQASRDIRASTGIDELLREDFDLYAPPPPPRRPAVVPTAPGTETPPASGAELGVARTDPAPPKPLSREEALLPDAAEPGAVPPPAAGASSDVRPHAVNPVSSAAAPATDASADTHPALIAKPARAEERHTDEAETPTVVKQTTTRLETGTDAGKPRED